jgi:hypothetical protein
MGSSRERLEPYNHGSYALANVARSPIDAAIGVPVRMIGPVCGTAIDRIGRVASANITVTAADVAVAKPNADAESDAAVRIPVAVVIRITIGAIAPRAITVSPVSAVVGVSGENVPGHCRSRGYNGEVSCRSRRGRAKEGSYAQSAGQ